MLAFFIVMNKSSLNLIYCDRIMMLRISRILRRQFCVEWTTTKMEKSTEKS
jgi:hypothetical protein